MPSRDGDKPSKYKTCLLTVGKLLLATLSPFLRLMSFSHCWLRHWFLNPTGDALCKDYPSWGVQWHGGHSQGNTILWRRLPSTSLPSSLDMAFLLKWSLQHALSHRQCSEFNFITVLLPPEKSKGNFCRSQGRVNVVGHMKYSVWCGEVTAQKHLFLINLLNQFGSSKPIPLTG